MGLLRRRAESAENTRVVAPRRFGKTSLLRRVAAEMEADGWATVYVDFFGVLTTADIAERIERAYVEHLTGRLATWFAGVRRLLVPTVRAGGGPVPVSAEVSLDARAEPPLLERLALPRRLYERDGTRTLVVFDEFQDVLAAGDRTDAVVRSEIQHHGDAASYVFAGSAVGMMRELFADQRRAFYGQAGPLDLGPLAPGDVAPYVDERFARTGRSVAPEALGALLDATAGHPQRTMLLAHVMWEATPPGGRADGQTWLAAWDRVLEVEVRDELRAVWSGLSGGQRQMLATIADDTRPLYSRAAQRETGGSRGGAPRAAVKALLDRGEVVEDARATTGHRVVDPLLRAWVRAGRRE